MRHRATPSPCRDARLPSPALAASTGRHRPRRPRSRPHRRSTAAPRPAGKPRPWCRRPAPTARSTRPTPARSSSAIDAGHGGCLDWGVPDPSERGVELAEKTLTLGIAPAACVTARGGRDRRGHDPRRRRGAGRRRLPRRSAATARLAGRRRRRPAGFEETGRVRTRDELQARIDLANLARADAFVSIHINSPSEGGQVIEIAFTETFYTDETPWGAEASRRWPPAIQDGVGPPRRRLTTYTRQDRGTEAARLLRDQPPLCGRTRERDGDEYCKPHARPAHARRPVRGRIDHPARGARPARQRGRPAGRRRRPLRRPRRVLRRSGRSPRIAWRTTGRRGAAAVPGDGPPFWRPVAPDGPLQAAAHEHRHRGLAAGLGASPAGRRPEHPTCASAGGARGIDAEMPALEPGESVVVTSSCRRFRAGSGRGMDLAYGRACNLADGGRRRSSWPAERPEPTRTAPDPTIRRYRPPRCGSGCRRFAALLPCAEHEIGHRPVWEQPTRSDRQETRAGALTHQPV